MTLTSTELKDYLENEIDHYGSERPGYIHPRGWNDGVMPLWEFDQRRLGRILDECDRPTPPPRWLRLELCQMESRAWHEWHWTRGKRLRHDPNYVPRARRHIPDALRSAVYERDGYVCLHCGTGEALSLDHIHPWSLGGSDTLDNLQTLCRPCNSRKGARV